MTTVMRALGRLMVAAAVVVALGLMLVPDAGAAPKNGTTKTRTDGQRDLCNSEGGTFTVESSGVFGFNRTSCTGGTYKEGDRHCSNGPTASQCSYLRPSPSISDVADERATWTRTPGDQANPASADEPMMTPLDETED